MGPGKLVRHMQNLPYSYDKYLICIGLGLSISSVICKIPSYSGPSYLSSPVHISYMFPVYLSSLTFITLLGVASIGSPFSDHLHVGTGQPVNGILISNFWFSLTVISFTPLMSRRGLSEIHTYQTFTSWNVHYIVIYILLKLIVYIEIHIYSNIRITETYSIHWNTHNLTKYKSSKYLWTTKPYIYKSMHATLKYDVLVYHAWSKEYTYYVLRWLEYTQIC